MGGCPGQDTRNLRIDLFKCQQCGAEVEMFSDEMRVKCHKCGAKIEREQMPSCIQWCTAARQCLGEDRWRAIMGQTDDKPADKPSAAA